jgi:hypothetical protein
VWKGPRTEPSVDEGGLGWLIASTRRERPRISERSMNSCQSQLANNVRSFQHLKKCYNATYVSHITRDLPNLDQEVQSCHPFRSTQSCFSRKVVQMCNKSLHQVCESLVWTLRIDNHGVFGNVVNCQVLHWGDFDGRLRHD